MRLAIADPPYLGRAARWYGDGVGIGGGRDRRADWHEGAHEWDNPARHQQLVRDLIDGYEGWAIAMTMASLPTYLAVTPADARVMVWWRGNAPASGARLRGVWEPVVTFIPPDRRGHGTGHELDDVLKVSGPRPPTSKPWAGFAGAKPAQWTRWVLDVLAYNPDTDTVTDLFPGSGAVGHEIAQGVLL